MSTKTKAKFALAALVAGLVGWFFFKRVILSFVSTAVLAVALVAVGFFGVRYWLGKRAA